MGLNFVTIGACQIVELYVMAGLTPAVCRALAKIAPHVEVVI